MSADMFNIPDLSLATNKVLFYELPKKLYDAYKNGFKYREYGINYNDLLMFMPENQQKGLYENPNPEFKARLEVAKSKIADGLARWSKDKNEEFLSQAQANVSPVIREALLNGWKWQNDNFAISDLNPASDRYVDVLDAARSFMEQHAANPNYRMAMIKNACMVYGNDESFSLGVKLIKLSNTLDENNNRKFRF